MYVLYKENIDYKERAQLDRFDKIPKDGGL